MPVISKIIPPFIEYLEIFIQNEFPNKYNYSNWRQKYDLIDILLDIFNVLEGNGKWSKYVSSYGIPYKTLHTHHVFLSKNNIYEKAYTALLNKYFEKYKYDKLKYQSIDTQRGPKAPRLTSFGNVNIALNGTNKAMQSIAERSETHEVGCDTTFFQNQYGVEGIGRNKFYHNKKGTKLSTIVDINGITIAALLVSGNMNDSITVDETLDNLLIETKTVEYKEFNKYRQYFLADKGYDTKHIRNIVTEKGYTPIIDHNNRNTKDIAKIKKLNEQEKPIYNKRVIVEQSYSWLKKNTRLECRREKKLSMFSGFIFLAFIKRLSSFASTHFINLFV